MRRSSSIPIVLALVAAAAGVATPARAAGALAAGAAAAQAPAATPPPGAPAVDIEATARDFVTQLAVKKYAAVEVYFQERLAKIMPADRLGPAWDQIVSQLGAFEKIETTRIEDIPGYKVVYVTCKFARSSMDIKISFDATGRVAGFFLTPPAADITWRPPAYARQDSFLERPVMVGEAPWKLPGTLSVPKGAGPFPAVILVHGSGPADEDESVGAIKTFKDLAWGLSSRGIAVLRYTKRTLEYADEMAQHPGKLTVDAETVQDARAAVALLAARPEIDPGRIFVLGHSLGGYLAPRIAAGEPRVAGIALLAASFRPLEDLMVEQVTYIANLDGTVSDDEKEQIEAVRSGAAAIRSPSLKDTTTVHVLGTNVPGSYWLDLRKYDPGQTAAALRVPILVLQAGRDYQVTQVDFDLWKKALAGRATATFKVYPALNHLFVAGSGPPRPREYATPGNVAQDAVQDIAAWILPGK